MVGGEKSTKNSYRRLKQVHILDYHHDDQGVDHYRNNHDDEYDDHLVDVEVETLLDPALRLLELLLEVHHLI